MADPAIVGQERTKISAKMVQLNIGIRDSMLVKMEGLQGEERIRDSRVGMAANVMSFCTKNKEKKRLDYLPVCLFLRLFTCTDFGSRMGFTVIPPIIRSPCHR